MSTDTIERALQSDAPLTAAVHQRDVAHDTAEAHDWHSAALVGRTVTIGRPRAELYAFWRDFRNLAHFMENIEAVTVAEDGRSHWTIKAPAGRTVEFDTVITEDVPDSVIGWESVDGDIKSAGRVEFFDAPPGRGSWVRVTMAYDPPGARSARPSPSCSRRNPRSRPAGICAGSSS
jgi:uncharacterized membrane protein